MRNSRINDAYRRLYKAERKWYSSRRWRKLAEAQKQAFPFCIMCQAENVLTIGTVADHITPHRGDHDLFWNGPLQTLCSEHHSSTKRRQETGGKPKALRIGLDGYPIGE
jgi:5-methylcytosine-specific restriction protein A